MSDRSRLVLLSLLDEDDLRDVYEAAGAILQSIDEQRDAEWETDPVWCPHGYTPHYCPDGCVVIR